MRTLSLAAGTDLGVDRLSTITVASDAGFDAVGLRFEPELPSPSELTAIRRRVVETGLAVLDLEVVRIGREAPGSTERLVEAGAALGARHLLVVSMLADRQATVARLSEIADLAEGARMGVVLEFMAFTSVKDLSTAIEIVRDTGHEGCGVLVDALHLARTGGTPDQVERAPRELFPYLQICDGPAEGPTEVEELAEEARHHRLAPGEGALALDALVSAVPGTPISLEVQQDERALDGTSPLERARSLFEASRRYLADQPSSTG